MSHEPDLPGFCLCHPRDAARRVRPRSTCLEMNVPKGSNPRRRQKVIQIVPVFRLKQRPLPSKKVIADGVLNSQSRQAGRMGRTRTKLHHVGPSRGSPDASPRPTSGPHWVVRTRNSDFLLAPTSRTGHFRNGDSRNVGKCATGIGSAHGRAQFWAGQFDRS